MGFQVRSVCIGTIHKVPYGYDLPHGVCLYNCMYVSICMAGYINMDSICINGCANLAHHSPESDNRACVGSTQGAQAGSVNMDTIDEVL